MRVASARFLTLLVSAWVSVAAAELAVDRAAHELADAAPMRIRVSLSQRRLTVLEGGKAVKSYPIAVGRPSNPTPTGSYRTGRIVWNPGWVPPPRDWAKNMKPRAPGDPRNPMQGVKIYFREPWYYIHGTNDPASIGKAASRGCIRMRPSDAIDLARRIQRNGGSVPLVIVH